MKFFNTAGPIKPEKHYHLSPLERIHFPEWMQAIQEEKYLVLHAPRQTGKTSMLMALMEKINQQNQYTCLYVNVEAGQGSREDVGKAMSSILQQLAAHMEVFLSDTFLIDQRQSLIQENDSHNLLFAALKRWAQKSEKPIVLLIDEIDALIGDTLISVLRQLRTGYNLRPHAFPHNIILCGVRDVRDYRIHASSEKSLVTGGSAFNINAASLRLGNFTRHNVEELLEQHRAQTGQAFSPQACDLIYEKTKGQPWLVNAIAYETAFKMEPFCRDRTQQIGDDAVKDAIEKIILRRETHLDQLADKLKEPRIHRVIAPLLQGAEQYTDLRDDDIDYAYDLGLIEKKPSLGIANLIYAEVIPRMLTYPIQVGLAQETTWFIDEQTGQIDMHKLLRAFQEFYRHNSEHWIHHYQYKEAGAQLLLQAFLQRIINGGGRIDREYGLGRGRTDLLVSIKHPGGWQRIVLELKIQRGTREATIEKALPQITRYMDTCGTPEGHLIIFNHMPDICWNDKIYQEQTDFEGHTIQLWGM